MMKQGFTNHRQEAETTPLAAEHMQTLAEVEDNMLVIVLAAMIGSALRLRGEHEVPSQTGIDTREIDDP